MSQSIPQFGVELPGKSYILRPGGYGIIRDDRGYIAVVMTPVGIFLPGGGQNPDESAEAALIRESMEECGLVIRVNAFIGIADEIVFSQQKNTYLRKRCTFFTAIVEGECERTEADHQLVWLSADDAISQLSDDSQKWAIRISG